VTYARRYALAAALGITADDDDGQAASSHAAPQAPKAAPVQATGNVMAELFTKAGLKYPDALEEALGKSMKEWSEVEKTLARDAIKQLQGGKSWKLIAAGLERDKAFS
jgi:hypothetical protein